MQLLNLKKFENTKGVIRRRKSKKDRQYNDQKKKDRQYNDQKKKDRQYNDQKKKDRQYNGQKKKDRQYNGQKKDRQYNGHKSKRTNTNLQNTTQKPKEKATLTPVKSGSELRCSRKVSSSCSTSGTHRVNLVTNPVICHE